MMDAILHQLIYYSRNRIQEDSGKQVEAILEASRRNNVRDAVTGALLFNRGCFGQILEGPRGAVEATFERIQRDPRHGDVSLLDFKPISSRHFDTWSMAFVGTASLDTARFAAIANETGFDPSRMSADALFEVLHGVALSEEQGN